MTLLSSSTEMEKLSQKRKRKANAEFQIKYLKPDIFKEALKIDHLDEMSEYDWGIS